MTSFLDFIYIKVNSKYVIQIGILTYISILFIGKIHAEMCETLYTNLKYQW